MADAIDIMDNGSGDLLLQGGDIVYSDATQQLQQDLLLGRKGDYKQAPSTGVGLEDFLEDEDSVEMMREIRNQFTADGMTVNLVRRNADGSIDTDADY